MGQVSPHFRRAENGYGHWCPGCEEIHVIPDTWTFNGDLANPTFNPSVMITGVKRIMVDGGWEGGWVRDADGAPVPFCCHYFLHAGQLSYCADSTHSLAGQTVPLPALPDFLKD